MIQLTTILPTIPGGGASIVTYRPGDDTTGITDSRASTASYIDVNGIIQYVATGIPRDQHFIGSTRTYLHEAASTNLTTQSNAFQAAPWAKGSHPNNVTFQTAVVGPDGVAGSGTNILFGGLANTFTNAILSTTPSGQVDGPVTSSLWLKARYSNSKIYIWHLTGSTYTRTLINLTTGWKRYSVTSTRSGTDFLFGFGIDGADAGQGSIIPSGNYEVHCFGYQMENLPELTSYIPTAGTTASRAADVFTMPFSTTPIASTIYMNYIDQGVVLDEDATGRTIFSAGGVGANRFTLNLTSTGPAFSLNYRTASTDHVATDATASLISYGDSVEVRATLSGAGASGISHSLNGAAETTPGTSSATLPGAWTTGTLELGTFGGAQPATMAIVVVKVIAGVQTMATARIALDAPVTPAVDTTPASIVVTPDPISMVLGGATVQMAAVVKNAAGTTIPNTIVWSSDNTGVATVNSSTGVVTSVAAGVCKIRGTSTVGTVYDESVTSVSIDTTTATVSVSPSTASLAPNTTQQLTSTSRNAASTVLSGKTPTWTTSNASVATVSAGGLVTGHAAGTATITATEGGHSSTCAVTVSTGGSTTPATTTVAPTTYAAVAGSNGYTFTATSKNGSGTVLTPAQAPITWTSSNTAVSTVNSATGIAQFLSAGTATITATTTAGTPGTATVTVTALAAVVPYSPVTPHNNTSSLQWTDFSYPPVNQTDYNYKAAHCDGIMNRPRSDPRYAANPSIDGSVYMLLYSAIIAGAPTTDNRTTFGGSATDVTSGDCATYCTANGYNVEDCWLHMYAGQGSPDKRRNVSAMVAGSGFTTLTVSAHTYTNGSTIEYIHGNKVPFPAGIPDGNYVITVIDANTFTIPVQLTNTPLSLGSTCNVLGDGTKTFANRLVVKWGSQLQPRFFVNPITTTSRAYHTARTAALFAPCQFLFVDEADSSGYADKFSNYNPKCLASLEYPMLGGSLAQQAIVTAKYVTDMSALIAQCRAASQGKPFQLNTSGYMEVSDLAMCTAAGGTQGETLLTTNIFAPLAQWSFWTSLLNAGATSVVAVDSKFWKLDSTPPGGMNPHNYIDYPYNTANNSPIGTLNKGMYRYKVGTFVSYMLCMGANPQYYRFDNSGGEWTDTPQSWKHLPLIDAALLGHPIETRQALAGGVTPDSGPMFRPSPNQTVVVNDPLYWRRFDNGLIVERYQGGTTGEGSNQLGDATTYTWTLPADRNYYFIQADGTVATSPVTTIQLNRSEAAVFICSAPATAGTLALRADKEVDKMGSNIHMDATPYSNNFSTGVIPTVLDLGMRTIRSGMFGPGADPPIALTAQLRDAAGVNYIWVMNPNGFPPASYTDISVVQYMMAHCGDPTMLLIAEGCNEIDNNNTGWGGQTNYGANYMTFGTTVFNWFRTNYPNIKISSPTVTSNYGATHAANYSAICDYFAVHPYELPNPPELNTIQHLTDVNPIVGGSNFAKPVIVTEGGYFNGTAVTQPSYFIGSGVTPLAKGKYIIRNYANNSLLGISYTCLYELCNDGADATNGESNFGLVNSDFTIQPYSYTPVKNRITLLSERTYSQPSFVVGNGDYINDTFVRANQSGWGTATGGADAQKNWADGDGNEAGQWAIVSNRGKANTTFQIRNNIGDNHTGDLEVYVEYRGIKPNVSNLCRTYVRYNNYNKAYDFSVNPGVGSQVSLNKDANTSLAYATYAAVSGWTDISVRVRARTIGSDVYLYAKVWQYGTTEPAPWTITAKDSAPASSYLTGSTTTWIDNNGSGQNITVSKYTVSSVITTAGSMPALSAFNPTRLDYTLSGATTNVKSQLFQKADGHFWLELWNNVSVFNTSTKADITNTNAACTITFNSGGTRTVKQYSYFTTTTPTTLGTGVASQAVSIPDVPILLEIY